MAKDTPSKKGGTTRTSAPLAEVLPTGSAPVQNPGPQPIIRTSAPLASALPTPTFSGVDLAGLATQGRAETNQRIAGQGSLMDAYLEQVLGMKAAEGQAATERDLRMQDFQRQQALVQEQLQRSRAGQDAALQRARIEAAAAEGLKDRDFRSAMTAEERAFELGQAATQRDRQDLEERMLELQIQQMEQELGPQQQGWGRGVAAAERGAELSPSRQNSLRDTVFTDTTESGARNWSLGWDFGTRKPEQVTTTYDDLMGTAEGYMEQYGEDPNEMVRRIKELARNRPQLASLLLHDIGYNPGAFLAPEG